MEVQNVTRPSLLFTGVGGEKFSFYPSRFFAGLCAKGMALLEMLGPLTQALLPFLPCQESLPGTCVIFLCGCHSHSESERAVSVSVLTCPAHL